MTRMGQLHVGTAPRITGYFTDGDGNPADPTTVTVRAIDPDGVTISTWTSPDAQITNPAVGTWIFDFPNALDDAGKYHVLMVGSGAISASNEISFTIHGTRVPWP